jgi:hypothetical protein
MPPATSRRVLLTFVLTSALIEAALQLGFLYWTLPTESRESFFASGASFIPDALIPVLRSAVLLALVTYWWVADYVERSENNAPRRGIGMLIVYIVLVQLFTRLFGALWSIYVNGPVFYWLVGKGYTPNIVQAYSSPVNALVQVTMMVGFSFWAFRLARTYSERTRQRSTTVASDVAISQTTLPSETLPLEVGLPEISPLETTPVTAAPRRVAASATVRKTAALFALSFLLLHVLGGEFALRMIGFLLIVSVRTGASTLPVTAAIVAFLAYAAARRSLPAMLPRVGAASAGLAAFRTYLGLHLAAMLIFAIYGAAAILADRGMDALLPMLLGMGMLYFLAIYPSCRRYIRRYYPPATAT